MNGNIHLPQRNGGINLIIEFADANAGYRNMPNMNHSIRIPVSTTDAVY
ncbi:hypothetical protein NIES2098_49790 [Calothrix sp. NIES-2098]|nr:hypothetical protein NIES2098_49790 [Calothrix sp. NIES-2098]